MPVCARATSPVAIAIAAPRYRHSDEEHGGRVAASVVDPPVVAVGRCDAIGGAPPDERGEADQEAGLEFVELHRKTLRRFRGMDPRWVSPAVFESRTEVGLETPPRP
jgi:hypothetical protein